MAGFLPNAARAASPTDGLARIEADIGGRLGVAALDVGTGRFLGHRADERFPLCSTFKVLACAAVLARVDAGQDSLDRHIRFAASDLVAHSPVAEQRVVTGMSLGELCEAGLTQSDNTAGNLVLASLGGPSGVTRYARGLGDAATRLDRTETALNEATPGDVRDTTTPRAMTSDLGALLLAGALSQTSRNRLEAWLVACQTGGAKLRAGLPAGWRVGDKTGGGDWGTTNDVAVIWPPGRGPVIVSAYLTQTAASFDARDAALASVGRAVADWLIGA